jgi:predicted dithiol-disulfide oxidoreductase (DUF899 family)/predicted enzyme related to lactoylglutathione lyase
MLSTNLFTQIKELEKEIFEKKKQLTHLRKAVPERLVKNYEFTSTNHQKLTLLELFGPKDELFVIHNMGKSCSYCTMWADGFNGVYHHLMDKASFVVANPDDPTVQEDFAASRKWQFTMISVKETTFNSDMGFQNGSSLIPGVSTFRKDEEGNVYLHAQAQFGPNDDYCVTWPLFDLLPSGANDVVAKKKLNNQSDFQLTNNIAIGVTNYENALKFYETILGMKNVQTMENETKFSISGTHFFIENNSANQVFFEFAVEDFKSAKKLLLENGCVITKEYKDTSVIIADPYGLRFHLFEVKKN